MDTLPANIDRPSEVAPMGAGGMMWADVAEAYLTNASRSGSDNTRRAYRRHLTAFAEAPLEVGEHRLPAVRTLSDVSPAHLMAWRAYIMDREGLSAGSRAQAIAALRGFMRWAGTQGLHSMPSDQ